MTRRPKDEDASQSLWEVVKDTIAPLKNRKGTGPIHKAGVPQSPEPKQTVPRHRVRQQAPTALKPTRQTRTESAENLSSHKRVRRGRIETQARIDLHGKRHDEARAFLLRRLSACAADNLRSVLVITGRGERDEGVLRTGLPNWMGEGAFRVLVSGYAPAHTRHGGKGAWYVFLRKNKPL